MTEEAKLEDTPYGRHIASHGWFVVNLDEALAVRNNSDSGAVYPLEGRDVHFGDFGVNVHVLWPGQPNGLYHSEGVREAFLVLSGECTLLVEEQERRLRQWDFFHCPPGTNHIIVGAGDGPCAILMIGARTDVDDVHYTVSELAAKYRASAKEATSDPGQAYADWPSGFEPIRLPWPVE